MLLAYEDVHWSDPTTQELLGLTIERVQRLPVLLLITFRPEFSPPWPAQPHVSALALTRLGRREGAALVERLVGDKPLPDEVAAQIVAKTDGVPLFVEELTKTVLESGLLKDAGDHYELAGPLPPLALPSTLHDSLLARLDRLAPVKEIAQIGAALGREFSHELLAAVADRPEPELQVRPRPAGRRRAGLPPRHRARCRPTASSTRWSRTPPTAPCSNPAASSSTPASRRSWRSTSRRSAKPSPSCSRITSRKRARSNVRFDYWRKAGERATARSANVEAIRASYSRVGGAGNAPGRPRAGSARTRASDRDRHAPDRCARATAAPQTWRRLQPGARSLRAARGGRSLSSQLSAASSCTTSCAAIIPRCADWPTRLGRYPSVCLTRWFALPVTAWPGSRPCTSARLPRPAPSLRRFCAVRRRASIDPSLSTTFTTRRSRPLRYLASGPLDHGLPRASTTRQRAAFRCAAELDQANLAAHVHNFAGAGLDELLGDVPAGASARRAILELALSTEHDLGYWRLNGLILRGWAMAQRVPGEAGIALLRAAIAADRAALGASWYQARYLCLLAAAYAQVGQTPKGLDAIAEAKALVARNERAHVGGVRLNRVEGELLQAQWIHPAPKPKPALPRPRNQPSTGREIAGTARSDQPRPAVARPGQACPGPRPARAGLRLVHRGLRHRRPEGRQGAARRAALMGPRASRS